MTFAEKKFRNILLILLGALFVAFSFFVPLPQTVNAASVSAIYTINNDNSASIKVGETEFTSNNTITIDNSQDFTFTVTTLEGYTQTEPTVNYKIGQEGATGVLTPTATNDTTYTYNIPSDAWGKTPTADVNIAIITTINTYTVTPTNTSGQNYNFTPITTTNQITHNDNYKFVVTPLDTYVVSEVKANGTPLTPSNGIYTTKITADTTFEITTEKKKYSIVTPSGEGYYITSNYNNPITHGSLYEFTLNLLDNYSASTPVVKYTVNGNENTLQPKSSANNKYNYSFYVTGDAYITVTGVQITQYNITSSIPTGASLEYITGTTGTTNNAKATHKTSISYRITLDNQYSQSVPSITYSVVGGVTNQQPDIEPSISSGTTTYVCTIPASTVTGNITLNVGNVNPNTYSITFPTVNGATISVGSGITNSGQTVTYGTDATFNVVFANSDTASYNVYYKVNNGTRQTPSKSSNTYTISGSYITDNIAIEIDYYVHINQPEQNNFTFKRIDDNLFNSNVNEISYGNTYKFTLTPADGYYISSVNLANGTAVSQDTNGVWQFTATQNDTIVVVAEKLTYIFTPPTTDETYSFTVTGGLTNGKLTHGTALNFNITLNEGYTNSFPTITYSVNGDTALSLSGETKSSSATSKVIAYTIPALNVTGNIQVFVSGIESLTYTVGLEGYSSEYYEYSGQTSVSFNQTHTFTLTMKDAYTQTDIHANYIKYKVDGTDKGFLTGSKVANTYTFTIPAESVNGDILICLSDTQTINKNTYTITVNNTLTTTRGSFSRTTINYYAYKITYGSTSASYGDIEDEADTTTQTFTVTHGDSVSLEITSYGASSWGGSTTYSQEQISARNVTTNQTNIWEDPVSNSTSTQVSTYNNLTSVTDSWELTIQHKTSYAYFYLPTLDASYIDNITTNYTTQMPIAEEDWAKPVTEDRLQYVGYNITTTSGEPATQTLNGTDVSCLRLEYGNSLNFSIKVGTQYGYNTSNMQVRFWYKNSSGNFSTSGTTISTNGNTYYINFDNTSYKEFYISVTGITRDAYQITPASGDGFTSTSTTTTPVTYADNYKFTIDIDTVNGWNVQETNGSRIPVVEYTVNGGARQSLNPEDGYTSGQTYNYNLDITGITVFYVSGIYQTTFDVNAIYVDQNNTSYSTDSNSFESDFEGGQIIPATNMPVAYNGTFTFSVWINTSAGYNGAGVVVQWKLYGADDTTYQTLEAVNGNYTISNILNHLTIKVSGITADTYYVSFPANQQGFSIQRDEGYSSNSVFQGDDFGWTITVLTGEGWYAGEDDANLRVQYYTAANTDNPANWITITGTRDEDGINHYLIEDINDSIYILVSGLTHITYTVTPPDAAIPEDGGVAPCTFELLEESYTVSYGGSFRFNVTVTTGYDPALLQVFYLIGDEPEDYKHLINKTGDYYIIANITDDITILWSAPTKLQYNVTVPTNTESDGYTFSTDDSAIVKHGESFSFKIELLASHTAKDGGIVVTYTDANGGVYTASQDATTYTISNIQSNITISVSNIERKQFTLTLPETKTGYTLISLSHTVANDATSVVTQYGEEFRFRINVDSASGYDASGAIVYLDNSPLSPMSGIYTVTDGDGIIKNHTITITGVKLQEFNVVLPTTTDGFNINSTTTTPVSWGSSYSFSVEIWDTYTKSDNFKVQYEMGGNTAQTLVAASDVYTIENITGHIRITVSGVTLTNHTVTLPTDPGYNIISSSSTTVSNGGSYAFSVTVNENLGYYKENFAVYYQTSTNGGVSWGIYIPVAEVNSAFTITNITADIKIVVEGVVKDSYTAALPAIQTGYSIIQTNGQAFTEELLTSIAYGSTFTFKISIDTLNGYYADETEFKVSYRMNNITRTLTGSNFVYNIENVTNNVEIYVDGVKLTYYNIILPELNEQIGYTLFTNSSVTVPYHGSFTWSIQSDSHNGYLNNYSVTAKILSNEEWVDRAIQPSQTGNTFTLNSIDSDIKIVVTPPTKQTRLVTLPSKQVGFSINALSNLNVYYGDNFQFEVTVDTANGYDENIEVNYTTDGINYHTLTKDNNVYTIENITENVSVGVVNVNLKQLTINFVIPTGVKVYNSTGATQITEAQTTDYGSQYQFKLVLDSLYSNASPVVNATSENNNLVLTLNALNNYVINSVVEDYTVNIQNVVMNKADYTELNKIMAELPKYPSSYYVSNTWSVYNAKLEAAQALGTELKADSQLLINSAALDLKTAYESLTLKTANYNELNEVLKQVPADLSKYTNESKQALEAAINMIKDNLDATNQDVVNGYASMVSAALQGLQEKDATDENNTGVSPWIFYLIVGALLCLVIALAIILIFNSRKIKPVFIKNEFSQNPLKPSNTKSNPKSEEDFFANPYKQKTISNKQTTTYSYNNQQPNINKQTPSQNPYKQNPNNNNNTNK